jgi:hypothetical protein
VTTRPFFSLDLWECRNVRSLADVIEVVKLVQACGLLPAAGPAWTRTTHPLPVANLEDFLAGRERPGKSRKRRKGQLIRHWGFALLQPDYPMAFNSMTIQEFQPDLWNVGIAVETGITASPGEAPVDISASSGALAENVGSGLYQLVRPALAAITARDYDEYTDFPRWVQRRQLIVGWRTWFGPPYVEAFGRGWLRQLPDETADLDDGGVFHQLDASVRSMTGGDPGAYAAVWPFLSEHGVRPAWPPVSDARARARAQTEADLREFRRMLVELLATTLVLNDGRRVKVLPLEWSGLRGTHRRVALASIREAAQAELRQHPGARVHFEFSDVPDELRVLMAELTEAHPQLSYARVEMPRA